MSSSSGIFTRGSWSSDFGNTDIVMDGDTSVDIPRTAYSDEDSEENIIDQFAAALELLRNPEVQDPLEVIMKYTEIIMAILMNDKSGEPDEKEDLMLETQFWELVFKLYTFRASDLVKPLLQQMQQELPSYASNVAAIEKYLIENTSAKEHHIILDWIKLSFTEPSPPHDSQLQGQKWLYTKNAIRQKGTLSSVADLGKFPGSVLSPAVSNANKSLRSDEIVNSLDVDAPLREGKSIDPKDNEFDTAFFRYVFELLRAGKHEDALNICKQTGNWQMRMVIAGVYEYFDDAIDSKVVGSAITDIPNASVHGIKNRVLWRRLCFQLSRNTSLSRYERGIYGILSGDLQSMLELSDSWESELFAYFSAVVASEDEQAVKIAGRLDEHVLESFPSNLISSTTTDSSVILNAIANSNNPVVKLQSANNYRVLMGGVIQNATEMFSGVLRLFDEMQLEAQENDDSMVEEEERWSSLSALLRVVTHYALFLKATSAYKGSDATLATLIRYYSTYLGVEKKDFYVPLYVSYLPDDLAVEVYGELLCSIKTPEQRKEHIALGSKYGLEMSNTIRNTVARVFHATADHYVPPSNVQIDEKPRNISSEDYQRISAIEWFQLGSLWSDAVHSSVSAFRDFLLCGKPEAARGLESAINVTAIVQTYRAHLISTNVSKEDTVSDSELAELAEYGRFVACLNLLEIWDNHSKLAYRYQTTNNDNFDRTEFYRVEPNEDWFKQANDILNTINQQLGDLVNTWMSKVEYPAETKEYHTIEQLKTCYIPWLIMTWLKILIDAGEVNTIFLRQAADLAILVADEKHKHYLRFVQRGTLEQFIKSIALAATNGFGDGAASAGVFQQK